MFRLGRNAHDFFVAALPAQLHTLFDWMQLRPLSEALHIGSEHRLRELRVDLLYRVRSKQSNADANADTNADADADADTDANADADTNVAYLLLEHKSSAHSRSMWQLHRYVSALMQQYSLFSEIIVVVLYHGREPWRDARAGHAVPEWATQYAPFGPQMRYTLIDLCRGDLREGSAETAHFRIGMRTLIETVRIWRDLTSEQRVREHVVRYYAPLYAESPAEYEVMECYLLEVVHLPLDVTKRIMIECVYENSVHDANRRETPMKSVADQLRDQGRTAGIMEGRSAGIMEGRTAGIAEGERAGVDKGRVEERVEVAQRMLREDSDSAFICRVTGLDTGEIDALRHSLNGSKR